MTTFSSEQLNFFKFSTAVIDEFPAALRQVFVYMWDTQVAPTPGFKKWDDSLLVRNMFLHREGGKTKYVPTNKSYMEWDCTALFEATLFAQSFAMPDKRGVLRTLDTLYAKPQRRRLLSGTFHPFLTSPSGNQAETFALALDQLRLLRNTLCHQISTQKIVKANFDNYIQLAKDAFAALGQSVTKIDDIGKLGEKDFPTTRLQELEAELRSEKFKQIEDNLDQIESQITDMESDVKDVKSGVTDVKTKVDEVRSDVKSAVTGMNAKVSEVALEVKSAATDVKTKVAEVGSDVKTAVTGVNAKVDEVALEVKLAATDVKTKVDEVASDVKSAVTGVNAKVDEVASDVNSAVTDVNIRVDKVGSAVQKAAMNVKTKVDEVESAVTEVKTKVNEIGSDVKIKVDEFRSDVITAVTDVKTKVDEVGSGIKDVKANVDDIKQAIQAGISKGPFVPDSCVPDNIPHFVGRQLERQAIIGHLTNEITRMVNVWGPPGFGKTSVAINVAHYLQDMKIPVYFAPLRGMKSKEELVSKLLSIFADASQGSHMLSSHWLIQCLQQHQNPFVLILDNADELLESEDAKRKQEVLRFIDEISAQCKQIKILLTTRESLDFLSHKLPIHLEKINVLDESSSASLVNFLLPDISEDDCSGVVKECGQVPLSMRLMCGIMREEHISLTELLNELKDSPLVEVLDSGSFPDDSRLKPLINTSFQRLPARERKAFVSLAVFPGWFGIKEATAVLDVKTELTSKKIIRSLERKSLVNCSGHFSLFTIHSLLRSFVDDKRMTDQEISDMFHEAQLNFYEYYISKFEMANESFLTGHSVDAFSCFLRWREHILLSLDNGTRKDKLYHKTVGVLSKAELLLYAILPNEESWFEKLYDTAVEEARRRKLVRDERRLLASKSFLHWGWFSSDRQSWDDSLFAGCIDETDCPAKLLCYHGIHQLLCGNRDKGSTELKRAVDRLNGSCDENVLKILVYEMLVITLEEKLDHEGASHFQRLLESKIKDRLEGTSEEVNFDVPIFHPWRDAFFHEVKSNLISVYFNQGRSSVIGFPENALQALDLVRDECLESVRKGEYNVIPKTVGKLTKEFVEEFTKNEHTTGKWLLDDFGGLPDIQTIEPLVLRCLENRNKLLANPLDILSSYNVNRQLLEPIVKIAETLFQIHGSCSVPIQCRNTFKMTIPLRDNFRNILRSYENVAGRDAVELARGYDLLGKLERLTNDFKGALDSHQHAIKLREAANFGDHVDTASSLTNIGYVYLDMENATEAHKAFQSALELRKQLGVYDHLDTISIYFALGQHHRTLENYEEALEAHLQVLTLRSKLLGEHFLTARAFNEVGYDYCVIGHLQSGKDSFQSALEINKKLLGENEETALSFHLLAGTCCRMKNYQEALEFCEEALAMRLELLGDHVQSAESFGLLALIHIEMGDNESAVQALEVAADMSFNLRGNSIHTAGSYALLGGMQCEMGNFNESVVFLQKAADMFSNVPGHDDMTATCYHGLGDAYRMMGDFNGALEPLQKAWRMRNNLFGEDHPDTVESFQLLYSVSEALALGLD